MSENLNTFLCELLVELPLTLNELTRDKKLGEAFIEEVGDFVTLSQIPKDLINMFIKGEDISGYSEYIDEISSRYI